MNIPVKIAGLGRYLPQRVVSNREVEALCHLPEGWIKAKTGVLERRWADKNETNAFMAAQATQEAMAQANLSWQEIDLIINASGTNEQAIPDGGPLLQRALGLANSGLPCFTIHATCLSFIAGLEVASSLISTGRYRSIVISSSEIASCGLNFQEPESATLLGDGAAAAVLIATPPEESSAIHAIRLETYSQGADYAVIRGGGSRRHPAHPETRAEDNLFHMEGSQLLKLTRYYGHPFLERLQPGLSQGLDDIKWVIPHQASRVGLRMLRHFGWSKSQIMITLDRIGNCVAASIPLTLYEAVTQHHIHRGDKILLIGTGAGLSLGGVILTY